MLKDRASSLYLIVGYGGIGSALADQLLQQKHDVIVISRKPNLSNKQIQHLHLDIANKQEINSLTSFFEKTIPDFIINTVGLLYDAGHRPEKTIRDVSDVWLLTNIYANTLPTLHLCQALSAVMPPTSKLKMLALSARLSSISDNRLGGWYSYRISKAALNMLIKTIAIEWSHHFPHACIAGYHPGTVDTFLSKPFQTRVDPHKLFSPVQAGEYLLEVLKNLSQHDNGKLFDWQGKEIAF